VRERLEEKSRARMTTISSFLSPCLFKHKGELVVDDRLVRATIERRL